jgi:hypothetical protein
MTVQERVELLREIAALWVELFGPEQEPEPGYVVRCGDCGSEYSYALGCCTGCGRS